MTEREKMLLGEQFEMLDPQLSEDRRRAAALLGRLNALSMDASGYRDTLGELLPHASDECLIRPPFYCDYGYSLFIGRGVFINFNCVMLDGAPIRIGDHVLIGPAVQIYTFTHPMDFEQRRRPVESCRPVATTAGSAAGRFSVRASGSGLARSSAQAASWCATSSRTSSWPAIRPVSSAGSNNGRE